MLSASWLCPGTEHGFHGRLEVRDIPRDDGEAVDLRRGRNERIHGCKYLIPKLPDHWHPQVAGGLELIARYVTELTCLDGQRIAQNELSIIS